jgi:hypothetical protein
MCIISKRKKNISTVSEETFAPNVIKTLLSLLTNAQEDAPLLSFSLSLAKAVATPTVFRYTEETVAAPESVKHFHAITLKNTRSSYAI